MGSNPTTAQLAFLDTETTGLDEEDYRIWEVGVILRGPEHETDLPMVLHIAGVVPDEFEERARQIGRYDARYGMEAALHTEKMAAWALQSYLAGRHLVGANPAFDQAHLKKMFRRHDLKPSWHHRLIDVEALAQGHFGLVKPMGLRQTADLMGIRYDPETLHGAYPDAELAMKIYDQIVHGLVPTEQGRN